ncbi:MAG: peptidoglycan-binding protein LysM [Lysobacteraceae bacterium]
MGFFDFISDAGEKLFGSSAIDENKVREHILSLGLKLNPFNVIADQSKKTVHLTGFAETLADKEKAIVAAGNIKGVEHVDDRIKVGPPPQAVAEQEAAEEEAEELSEEESPASRFYTVVSGDTLSAIARREYGNANKYPVIFEANKPMLTHPDKIYPGQVLLIPRLDEQE